MPEPPDLSLLTAALTSSALSFDGVAGYAIGGTTPSVVVKPSTQAEAATALGAAHAAGAAVVPFGGGTQQSMGMAPRRYDVALDLTRIDTLIEHEPADLTVTVEAGMRLSTLQRLLGERGQWLPLDPPAGDDATIGGVLATNASGPTRLSRGTARDLVIGMTVATAQGELVKSGGRVVKNVAGYDMAKLHIGALGTLGVILQASFKVSPLPAHTAVATTTGELEALVALNRAVEEARLALQAAVLTREPGASAWTLALRFAGGQAAVERSVAETHALAAPAGLVVEDAAEASWRALLPAYDGNETVARLGVPVTELSSVLVALASAGARVSAYPGVGVAYGAWPGDVDPERLRLLREVCSSKRGSLVLEKATVETKRAFDPWGPARSDFGLMQRLKQELDPSGLLNPGRFIGGL